MSNQALPQSPRHILELDGLRGIAVLLVLWAHFPFIAGSSISEHIWKVGHAIRSGFIGVDLFFVLSGFLITRLLLAEKARTKSVSLKLFYAKRALRILPIYYLCLVLYALLGHPDRTEFLSLASYSFNYFKPFDPSPMALEHTWSLSVEEQFYLVWPFLISVMPFAMGRLVTGVLLPLTGIVAAVMIARWGDASWTTDAIYMFSITRMMSLSLGAYLAFREAARQIPTGAHSSLVAAGGVAVLLAVLLGRQHGLVPQGGYYWAIALVGYAMFSYGAIALVTRGDMPIFAPAQALLRVDALRYIGKISYGLYLYHYPILFLFGIAPFQAELTGADLTSVSEALITTFLVAILSFQFIESPLLRLKDRLHAPDGADMPSILSAGPTTSLSSR